MDRTFKVVAMWYKVEYDMASNRQEVLGREIKTISTGLPYAEAVKIVDEHVPSTWLLGLAVINEEPKWPFDNPIVYQRLWTENLKWL